MRKPAKKPSPKERALEQHKKIRTQVKAIRKTGYKVGYRNPPKETRFKPGQSGNPKGRPKRPEISKYVAEQLVRYMIKEEQKPKTLTVALSGTMTAKGTPAYEQEHYLHRQHRIVKSVIHELDRLAKLMNETPVSRDCVAVVVYVSSLRALLERYTEGSDTLGRNPEWPETKA